jgi:hypothetical protein
MPMDEEGSPVRAPTEQIVAQPPPRAACATTGRITAPDIVTTIVAAGRPVIFLQAPQPARRIADDRRARSLNATGYKAGMQVARAPRFVRSARAQVG